MVLQYFWTPSALITGWFDPGLITTSVDGVGNVPQDQLVASFQSVGEVGRFAVDPPIQVPGIHNPPTYNIPVAAAKLDVI